MKTASELRRDPTPSERSALYQLAKDAASLSLDQPYNAARAALWDLKWLSHTSADELAEQAAARILAVRTRESALTSCFDSLMSEHLEARVPEELDGLWPAPDAQLPPHVLA